jgi:hypothetical protein
MTYADEYDPPPPRVTRTRLPVSNREERRLERLGLLAPVTGYTEAPNIRPAVTPEVRNSVRVTTRALWACAANGTWIEHCPTCGKSGRHAVAALIPYGSPTPACSLHGYLTRQEYSHDA